ncbi:MAG: ribonuclease R [Acidihalobacter sp.]|jgi:ribonuclease R
MSRKKRTPQLKDPHFEREAAKYDRPIPSREMILEVLGDSEGPLRFDLLAERLGLAEDVDREALGKRVRAMVRDGQILENRRGGYVPVTQAALVRGRVIGHPDGFGFLVPDSGGDDLFLSPRQMRSLFHGDRAVARVVGVDRRGRREGAVVEVLERNTEQVVGRYFEERGIGFVTPDNRRLAQDIVIPPEQRQAAQPGQIVIADITEQPTKHSRPIGRIVQILGEHMAPGMETEVAIHSYGLPVKWPDGVTEEADRFGAQIRQSDLPGRVDLRGFPLVTIDGEDARDFDDAVYCEPLESGFNRLIVAIADVATYVKPDSALDVEARQRGNSVYFPERVIPMLPEVLSNGLCSLNPEVERLCMIADMVIDPDGNIARYAFHEGVMRSVARLTYNEVSQIVEHRDPEARNRRAGIVRHLDDLYHVYKVLRASREQRGAIDFDTQETRIVFGPERKIERIVPTVRNQAHMLIEECMIAANVAAARFLKQHRMPTLYRVHEGPPADKIEDLRSFLGEVGLSLGGGDEPEPLDYARLIKRIQGRADFQLIQQVLLRSLSQAVYSPKQVGHFGLAHEDYVHFTSPIRRYPDLIVHRAIKHALKGRRPEQFVYSEADLEGLGEHCSMTERRADEATRDVADWLKTEYMQDKLGETFDGIINTVTSFGLFVELKDIYVEGLVHVTSLPHDYYQFDPTHHRMRGERSGRTYRVGDSIRVTVARVNLDERKIDFVPAEQETAKRSGGPKRSARRRRRR